MKGITINKVDIEKRDDYELRLWKFKFRISKQHAEKIRDYINDTLED